MFLLTVGCAGWAKQSTEWNGGRCTGKVVNEAGEALAGATIVLSGSGKGTSATTDANGRFEMDPVPGQTEITAYYADVIDKKPAPDCLSTFKFVLKP
jgi:hypothetical protein